jgi:hypothetical protein
MAATRRPSAQHALPPDAAARRRDQAILTSRCTRTSFRSTATARVKRKPLGRFSQSPDPASLASHEYGIIIIGHGVDNRSIDSTPIPSAFDRLSRTL